MYVPSKVFFTKGAGTHKEYLHSFESALRDAGIEKQNLVTVSSILPPDAKELSWDEGIKFLKPGEITFAVMARNSTDEPNRLIAASIGYARPIMNPNYPSTEPRYGYLSEHHPFGEKKHLAGKYAESLAANMFLTAAGKNDSVEKIRTTNPSLEVLLNKEFPGKIERVEKSIIQPGYLLVYFYDANGEERELKLKTGNFTQTAEGNKNGNWTTVVSAAILLP